MKITCKNVVIAIGLMVFLASCNTIEQASTHGLHSGFYKMKTENKHAQPVYLDVINEQIEVYQSIKQQPDTKKLMTISFNKTESVGLHPLVFKIPAFCLWLAFTVDYRFKYCPVCRLEK
jgi:hypothetical protein